MFHGLLLFSHPVMSNCCNPMDCSTPDLSVPHHLPKFAQIHVRCIGDAIQPSHLLMPSSPSAPISPSIRSFSNESAVCIRGPVYWSFSFSISSSNEYSGLISLKIDQFDLSDCKQLKMARKYLPCTLVYFSNDDHIHSATLLFIYLKYFLTPCGTIEVSLHHSQG